MVKSSLKLGLDFLHHNQAALTIQQSASQHGEWGDGYQFKKGLMGRVQLNKLNTVFPRI